MNIIADESIDGPIVTQLRQDGHNVEYVAEMAPGISDDAVLEHANHRQAVLMTADKDFGELVFRLQKMSCGVILVRLPGLTPSSKARLVSASLRSYATKMVQAFTVISTGRIRIRHGV